MRCRSDGHAVLVLLFVSVLAASAEAQDNVLDLRFLELNEDGDRTYHNFLYSRSFPGSKLSFAIEWRRITM